MQDINKLIKECDNDNKNLVSIFKIINNITNPGSVDEMSDEVILNMINENNMTMAQLIEVLSQVSSGLKGGGSSGVSFDSLSISLTKPSNIGSLGADNWYINRIIKSGTNRTYYLLTDCLIRGKFSDATFDSNDKIQVASHSKYMNGTLPCIYKMSNDGYKLHNGALEFSGDSSGTSIYFSPDGDLPSGNIEFYIMINGVVEGDLSYEQ